MKARRKLVRKPKVVRPEPTRDETRRFASRASLGLAALGAMIGLVVLANRWVAREEVRIMPLLPIEKKLIVWSLVLGVVLLVVLAFLNRLFPPTL